MPGRGLKEEIRAEGKLSQTPQLLAPDQELTRYQATAAPRVGEGEKRREERSQISRTLGGFMKPRSDCKQGG